MPSRRGFCVSYLIPILQCAIGQSGILIRAASREVPSRIPRSVSFCSEGYSALLVDAFQV